MGGGGGGKWGKEAVTSRGSWEGSDVESPGSLGARICVLSADLVFRHACVLSADSCSDM